MWQTEHANAKQLKLLACKISNPLCLRNGSVFQEGVGKYNKPINVQVEEMVVFLHRTEPDLEFEGLLKRRHTQIKYLSVAFASTFGFNSA